MKRPGRRDGGRTTAGARHLQRKSRRRPAKTRILIVCEGRETEPNYFRGLRDEETVRQSFSLVVQKGKGGSCLAVVQQAVAEREKAAARGEDFDEVWCVFDVERAEQREQVVGARKLADQHGIHLALSNPSFEVWELSHFVRTSRSFASCEAAAKELNKHWRREFGHDYQKNDEHLYMRLASRTGTAVDNARRVREHDWDASRNIVDCNSATDVYRLLERLLGLDG
jgi:RloB-like protein